jgi:hypothetical protein
MKTLMFKYQLSLLVKQTEWMLEETNEIKEINNSFNNSPKRLS